MRNTQTPLKPVALEDGVYLTVHSIFKTIQGEGPFAGLPAIFIRLSGCNLQCPMCDTDYTGGRRIHVLAIVDEVRKLDVDNKVGVIVVTGGEPFRQPLGPLTRYLVREEFYVQIETNGTLWQENFPNIDNVAIVCSPKTGKVHVGLQPRITAYKYVARASDIDLDDGLPQYALGHPANPRLARPHEGFGGEVFLQPADEGDPVVNRTNLDAVVASCLKHGHTLCLQVHKIVGVP